MPITKAPSINSLNGHSSTMGTPRNYRGHLLTLSKPVLNTKTLKKRSTISHPLASSCSLKRINSTLDSTDKWLDGHSISVLDHMLPMDLKRIPLQSTLVTILARLPLIRRFQLRKQHPEEAWLQLLLLMLQRRWEETRSTLKVGMRVQFTHKKWQLLSWVKLRSTVTDFGSE